MTPGVIDPAAKHLTYVERFIEKYYMKQTPRVRSITFIVFVALFAAAFLRLVMGNVVLTGLVFEAEVDHHHPPARNYDVRVADRLVGTNSKGEYEVALSPIDAAVSWAKGSLSLAVNSKNGDLLGKHDVPVSRRSLGVDDLFLDKSETITVPPAQAQLRFPWIAVLNAEHWNSNRLFVREFNAHGVNGRLTIHCTDGCNGDSLRAARSAGTDAGSIPISSGKRIFYDFDYFFEVPTSAKTITLSTDPDTFFARGEKFWLRDPANALRLGEERTIEGSGGSTVSVLLLRPEDLVLLVRDDVRPKINEIKTRARSYGLGFAEGAPDPNEGPETNTLFVGKEVSVEGAQAALKLLVDLDIPLKSITRRNLRSGNQHQVQLGGTSALSRTPRFPPDVMRQLQGAIKESEFWKIAERSNSK